MTLRSLPFLRIAAWCGSLALLSSCALIGGAGKADESGLGGVDGAFHNAFYKAQVAKLKGDREGAKEALLSCLDAHPDEAVVHYELARLEREAEQWGAAHAAILEANALDGDNPWYHTEWADIALELGLYDEADDALEWVLQNKPEDERSARTLLNLRTAQGDLDGALRVVDVLEREWGPDPEWHFDRHRLFMGAGDFESGLEALERLEEDFPDVVEATLQRARILSGLGREAEAEAAIRSALDRTGNGRLHLEWAHILTRRGETEAAREHVRTAFASDEVPLAEKADIAWTYVELAELQPDLRPEAEALIALLIEGYPMEAEPHDIEAALRDIEGDAEGALQALEAGLELDPNSPDRWLEACQLAIDLERWDAVDDLSERAGLRFPNLPVFPYFRGLAQLEMGDGRGAERQLKTARNLIVDRPEFESDVLSTLAQIAHDRGEHAASDDWFELALEANPNNILALNNYAYYLALRGAKPERAVELAAKVVALSPGNGNFEDTYAWALHKAGDHAEALTWIDLAIAHEGRSPGATILEHAGDILDALGRREEARARWADALDAGGDADRLNDKIHAE